MGAVAMDPVPHVLRGLPLWWQTLIRENYGWALQDGYMQDENRRRDLDFFQIYSGDGQDRVLSEYQKESQLHLIWGSEGMIKHSWFCLSLLRQG